MAQIAERIQQRQIGTPGTNNKMSEAKIFNDLISGKAKLAVIGLGYVGLPIALEFAKKISVIGFDINEERIQMMKKGIDPSNELHSEDFKGTDILFTSKIEDLRKAKFFIVAVPTPV